MPKPTIAQIALLLADYDAAQRDKRKAEKREAELKQQIIDLKLAEKAYGEWTYALGTPREILDQPAARKMITDAGGKVPTVMTKAPIVVKPKAGK